MPGTRRIRHAAQLAKKALDAGKAEVNEEIQRFSKVAGTIEIASVMDTIAKAVKAAAGLA